MIAEITSVVRRLTGFGKTVISEVDGTGSSSRLIGLIVAIATMGVLIAHVCIHHALPAPAQLGGLSSLVAAGSGAYAANKMTGGNQSAPPSPPKPVAPPSSELPIITPPEGGH